MSYYGRKLTSIHYIKHRCFVCEKIMLVPKSSTARYNRLTCRECKYLKEDNQ